MKKKVLFRSLFGLLSGVALGQLIAIVISAVKGDGSFYAVIPELVNDFGGELSAAIVQTALLGVFGAIVGAASVIWELDRWSLTKQTGAHFCLFAIPFTIVAYVLYWVPRSVGGVVISVIVLVVIYAAIWCGTYFSARKKIQKINNNLHKE
ncbi:histidine kinase [Oscillospiraceae bacterium]|nr:histidine kinase [Oscillospiraceae bacterium]